MVSSRTNKPGRWPAADALKSAATDHRPYLRVGGQAICEAFANQVRELHQGVDVLIVVHPRVVQVARKHLSVHLAHNAHHAEGILHVDVA